MVVVSCAKKQNKEFYNQSAALVIEVLSKDLKVKLLDGPKGGCMAKFSQAQCNKAPDDFPEEPLEKKPKTGGEELAAELYGGDDAFSETLG